MNDITARDLVRLLTESAGELDFTGRPEEALDLTFAELGCDSLALLETAARIQQEYGVVLDDDAATATETPRALLAAVNGTPARLG
ncbi:MULTISPECIES: acyl carrier protein [Streptomyces]|uniref:acyl carrier protein n=1 Tax=Streptomyces TaxID=1883 RepID=UPI00163BE640|nr:MULTISPECIES: acyl carrier protein [Streptomyces]MBC2876893.1 acyl carrier protein [Streptomyces sp. TYQ1024]UBI35921.1 acyl carrier protein [Streptomyces mobaraensis]UKW28515.1 acyl carrier protein [Streptomyces sp. TYQ1024]